MSMDKIDEIIGLSYDPYLGRKFSLEIIKLIEELSVAKYADGMDTLLIEYEKRGCLDRLPSVLRSLYHYRDSIAHWYDVRARTLTAFAAAGLDGRRTLRGMLDCEPGPRTELDGLDMWQSIIKECGKYA